MRSTVSQSKWQAVVQRWRPRLVGAVLYFLGVATSVGAMSGIAMFRMWTDPDAMTRNDPSLTFETTLFTLCALAIFLAWVSVFFRQTRPLLLIGIGAFLALVLQLDYLLLAIGLAHWLGQNRSKHRWPVAGAGFAVIVYVVVRNCLRPNETSELNLISNPNTIDTTTKVFLTLLIAVMTVVLVLALGVLWTTRHDKLKAQDDTAKERERSAQLQDALSAKNEREAFAREVHDTLAHRLSLLSLKSQSIADAVQASNPEQAQDLVDLRQLTNQSLADLRGLLNQLRSEQQPAPATVPASTVSLAGVPALVESARESGVALDERVQIVSPGLASPEVGVAAYRIVQESMTNAIKHGSGEIFITVVGAPGHGVYIDVRNPLPTGETPPNRTGMHSGVAGMRQRALSVGGSFNSGVIDRQYVVTATLPWSAPRPR